MKKIYSIFKKELKELFRDKKTVMMSIVFPLVLYPTIIAVSSLLTIKGQDNIEEIKSRVAFEEGINEEIIEKMKNNEEFLVVESDNYEDEINNGKLEIYLKKEVEGEKIKFVVYYDSARENGKKAIDRFEEFAREYKREKQEEYLAEKNINIEILDIIQVEKESISKEGKEGRSIIAMILPLFLIIPIFLGCLYSALDLTSGEKERKTLETLMTLPVKKEEILLAKLFATVSFGMVGLMVNVVSLGITLFAGMFYAPELKEFVAESLSMPFLITMLVSMIPILFFISGVSLLVGIMAKDYKEAQSYASPLTLIILLPIYFVMSPGWNLEGLLTYTPIVNVFLLMKLIALEGFLLSSFLIVFIVNLGVSIVSMIIFAKLFQSETILFSEEKGFNFSLRRIKESKRTSLEVSEVILLYIFLMFVLVIFGGILQSKFLILGVFLTQVILILLPPLLLVYTLNIDFSIFKLKKVESKKYLDAVGIWAVGFLIMVLYNYLQNVIFPGSLESLKILEEFLGDTSIIEKLVAISLAPAICEELLFRGLIYGSLEKKIGVKKAIIISGLLFGAFHLYPAKILTTGILGIFFAFVVYKTGSIYPAMFIHFLNNALALLTGELALNKNLSSLYSVVLILFVVFIVYGINYFYKLYRKREVEE